MVVVIKLLALLMRRQRMTLDVAIETKLIRTVRGTGYVIETDKDL